MSKNLTRKGIAFGAAAALGATVFAGTPAFATVNDAAVSLVPVSGTEYSIVQDNVFDLVSNQSLTAVSGSGKLKFLVTDPSGVIRVDADIDSDTANTAFAPAEDIASVALNANSTSAEIITVNTTAAHRLVTGDKVTFTGTFAAGAGTAADFTAAGYANTSVTVVDSDTFTFVTGADGAATTSISESAGKFTFKRSAISAATASGTTLTVTVANASQFLVGDVVDIKDLTSAETANTVTVDGDNSVVTAVDAASNKVTFLADDATGTITLGGNETLALTTPENNTDLDSRARVANAALGNVRILGIDGVTVGARAADKSFVVNTAADSASDLDTLRLVSVATTGTSATATVTAWIDENGDGVIDGTEDSSSTRTINFVPWTSAAATLNFEQPVAGLSTFKSTVTFDSAINASQITAGRLELGLGRIAPNGSLLTASAGTTVTSGAFTATADAVNWNSTTKKWELGTVTAGVAAGVTQAYGSSHDLTATSAAAATLKVSTAGTATTAATFVLTDSDGQFSAIAAGDVLKVTTAIADADSSTGVGNFTVTAASSTEITFTGIADNGNSATTVALDASAETATGGVYVIEKFSTSRTYAAQIILDNAVYGSVSYKTVGAAAVDAAPTTALTRSANAFVGTAGSQSHVRLKATAVQLVASLKKDAKAVGAGVAATVRVTRDSLHADSTITVGGKTLTSTTTAGYVEYEATTNADGKIVIDIANSKGDESDGVTVTVTSSGLASVGHAIDWDANDYTKYDFTESSAVVNSIKAITKGSAYTLNWNIADEFGAGPAEDWQVKVTYTFLGASQTQAVKFVPFASGKASLAITDASTAAGSYTVAAVAQKRNVSSGNFEDVDPHNSYFANASDYTFNTTVVVRDVVEAKALSLTATSNAGTSASLEADDFTAVDYRYNRNQDNTAYDNTEYYTLSGVVTDANGAGLPGASVTVSAEGFAFVAGDVSAVGSITVVADASGNYSVKGVSHKAGTYKVTAVAGAVTKTADVTVDNSTTAADIKSVTITALDKISAGYTAAVKVTVLDKWGNAVKDANAITLTHVGPGYLSAYPTAVSATDGSTTFVLISAGAKGIASFTVKAAAGTATTDDVTATKNILVGLSASVSAGSKKANVVVKYATGGTVTVVSGTKSVTKIATSDSFKVSLTKLTKGKKTVKVYVNDVLIASKSVTVKK